MPVASALIIHIAGEILTSISASQGQCGHECCKAKKSGVNRTGEKINMLAIVIPAGTVRPKLQEPMRLAKAVQKRPHPINTAPVCSITPAGISPAAHPNASADIAAAPEIIPARQNHRKSRHNAPAMIAVMLCATNSSNIQPATADARCPGSYPALWISGRSIKPIGRGKAAIIYFSFIAAMENDYNENCAGCMKMAHPR